MFRRNETRTRGQLLRAELGDSWDHALRAAGHAAGGVRATVGPKVAPAAGRVRGVAASGWGATRSALAPLSEAAQHGVKSARRGSARRGRKPARRRWPMVAGLVTGGVAVGATAAYLVRRRRQQDWEDYQAEPLAVAGEDSLATGATGAAAAGGPATRSAGEPVTAGSGSAGPVTTGPATAGEAAGAGPSRPGGGPDRSPADEQKKAARPAESVNAAASRNNRT